MNNSDSVFDDFVDDCFLEEDPLCNRDSKESLELSASKLISELLAGEEEEGEGLMTA